MPLFRFARSALTSSPPPRPLLLIFPIPARSPPCKMGPKILTAPESSDHSLLQPILARMPVRALVVPNFLCICLYSCLFHQTGNVNRDWQQTGVKKISICVQTRQKGVNFKSRPPPNCKAGWVYVCPCYVPASMCCVRICAHILKYMCGVEITEPAACPELQACTPEKMSFSFMMLTSRLVRRTAALSMICSGL